MTSDLHICGGCQKHLTSIEAFICHKQRGCGRGGYVNPLNTMGFTTSEGNILFILNAPKNSDKNHGKNGEAVTVNPGVGECKERGDISTTITINNNIEVTKNHKGTNSPGVEPTDVDHTVINGSVAQTPVSPYQEEQLEKDQPPSQGTHATLTQLSKRLRTTVGTSSEAADCLLTLSNLITKILEPRNHEKKVSKTVGTSSEAADCLLTLSNLITKILEPRNHEKKVSKTVGTSSEAADCLLTLSKLITKTLELRNHENKDPYSSSSTGSAPSSPVRTPAFVKIKKAKNVDRKMLTCSFKGCSFRTRYSKDIRRHTVTHTGIQDYQCEVCLKRFSRANILRRHQSNHRRRESRQPSQSHYSSATKVGEQQRRDNSDKPFSCQVCDFKCNCRSELLVHQRTHTGDAPFNCQQCPFRAKTTSGLKRHLLTHSREKHSCPICHYSTGTVGNLKNHMAIWHKEQKKDVQSTSRRALRKMKTVSLECDACKARFVTSNALRVHIRHHKACRKPDENPERRVNREQPAVSGGVVFSVVDPGNMGSSSAMIPMEQFPSTSTMLMPAMWPQDYHPDVPPPPPPPPNGNLGPPAPAAPGPMPSHTIPQRMPMMFAAHPNPPRPPVTNSVRFQTFHQQ